MIAPVVSVEWLHDKINDPEIIILDASQKTNKEGLKTEFEGSGITGARLFDIENVFSDQSNELPNMLPDPGSFEAECRKLGINQTSKIIIYDNLGIYTSPRAWWMFKIMGHDDVAVLDGGLPDWVEKGFPTESVQNTSFKPGNFKANYHPELVVNVDELTNNLESKKALVIDARSEGRFSGASPEPRAGLRRGHIPHSINIPFKNVLDNGKFKSEQDLVQVFTQLQDEDRPLIFSCGSGITACIVYLAHELIKDKQKAVYDGSWTEWAQLMHLPVE